MFSLDEIIKAVHAGVIKKDTSIGDLSISTDSRTIQKGQLYLPLKGEKFNGEDFIPQALANGAVGYFTTSDVVYEGTKIVLQVHDYLRAYLDLAWFYKNIVSPKVVAVTGSSGKTTTKEMLYSVISQKYKTHKTEMNFNNEIGFCKTVLSMPRDTEVLILEMGMRGFGEIDLLAGYSKPDVAIITNIGTAHIGRLGSRENIAKAKCEIASYINDNGILIAPDEILIRNIVPNALFINQNDINIISRQIGNTKFLYKNYEYELNIEGDYNVSNAILAIEAGLFLSIDEKSISNGLKMFNPVGNRWNIREVKGYKFINDSYNANPDSMKAVIKTVLQNYSSPLLFVLGDMGELGKDEVFYHQQIGEYLNKNISDGVDVITVGNLASEISQCITVKDSPNFETCRDAAKYILDNVPLGTTIVLKASHSMMLDDIIKFLEGRIKL